MQRALRIAIQTLGTRGDVQPYIALALSLMRRGHAVQLAAPAQFETLIVAHGIAFAPLPGEFLALLDTAEGKAAVAGGQGFSAGLKLLKYVRPLMGGLLDAEWDAVRAFAPDAIVYHPKSLATPLMAQKLSIPHILVSPLPGFTPTAAFPSPLLPFRSLGPFNRASHLLAVKGAGLLFGRMLRQWRRETLGLPSRGPARPSGTIYAYSPAVVPVPADWGSDVLVSGYLFLDSPDWVLPASLQSFLEGGEPPVYVGFGSMPGVDAERLTGLMVEALARCGRRGLFATGGGALGAPAPAPASHVHLIAQAPHDRLFKHVSATIHHGGAGTTAASLRAGKPMTIIPFFGDQPFWARRMSDLGVAPAPLDRKRLSVEDVASAIARMTARPMRDRASALGAVIRHENGCAASVRFIEGCVGA